MSTSTVVTSTYIQPQRQAEASIRLLVDRPNDGSRLPTAMPEDRLDNDLVQLSDRADVVLSQYGSDASLEGIKKSLSALVLAANLAKIGSGLASETKAPKTSSSEQTLLDGSVRATTVDQTAQSIQRSQTIDGGAVIGGQSTTTTTRISRAVGGKNIATGAPLADTVRRELTTSKVVADLKAGIRTETFTSAALITSSDTANTRSETLSRVTETRTITNASGRFIQQTVKEDYQSVATGVAQGAEIRSSNTVTLVNLDTGEVTRSIQSASSSATARIQNTGTGESAASVQTISVRNDLRNVSIRAGGLNDVTDVTENLSSETATVQQTTKSGATTKKLSTTVSTSSALFTGVDQTVLTGSKSTKNESASLDSLGAYAATTSQRETQFALAKTGRLVTDEFDRKAPFDQIPETSVVSASSLYRTASVGVSAAGKLSVNMTEESQKAQNGSITPALSSKLSVNLPAPIGGAVVLPAISTPTANGKLTVQPSTPGKFTTGPVNSASKGAVVSANLPVSQLKALDNTTTTGPSASVNAVTSSVAAARQSGANGVSGVLKADAQNTIITAKTTAATDGRTVTLKADGAGNFYTQSGSSSAFVRVSPLNLTV